MRKFIRITHILFALLLVLTPVVSSFIPQGNGNVEASASVGKVAEATDIINPINKQFVSASNQLNQQGEVDVIIQMASPSLSEAFLTRGYSSIREFALSGEGRAINNNLMQSHNSLKQELSSIYNIKYNVSYTSALNGFSATVNRKDIEAIKKHKGVESVIVSEVYSAPKLNGVTNPVSVFETGIYDTSDIEFDGTGTVVAVFDTGLDYTHPAFSTMPPADTLALTRDRLAGVFDSLTIKQTHSGLESSAVYINDKIPFGYSYADKTPDVYPKDGHGTHVAGIIAGKDDSKVFEGGETFSGVAPGAQLAIFKVFSNNLVGAKMADILAGVNDASLLGIDVMNLSLGSANGFASEEDLDKADQIYDNLRNAGVSIMVSAGNEGNSSVGSEKGSTNLVTNPDSGTMGSPATYNSVMAVASIDGVMSDFFVANGSLTGYITDSSDSKGNKMSFAKAVLGNKATGEFTYVTIPGTGSANSNYRGVNVEGKIALVKRGVSSFEDKIRYARQNGAIGIIIYNNVSGTINMSIGKETGIPSCSVLKDVGEEMAKHEEGKLVLSSSNKAGPFISNFSSWGATPDLDLKPEITAHGGYIVSAVPGEKGYETQSGTSMASPNMAGVATILRQALKERYPTYTPVQINTLLNRLIMSTASVAINEDGNPYSPRKQGAGLASLYNAVNTDAYLYVDGIDKTKLSLGDDPQKTGVYNLAFKIKNLSNLAKSYRLSACVFTETVTLDGKNVNERAYMFNNAKIEAYSTEAYVNGDIVTIGGLDDVELNVKVTLTSADKNYLDQHFANGMYVEGFARLVPVNANLTPANGVELSIPYLAFYGDWTQAPLFDVTEYEVAQSAMDNSVLDQDKLKADVVGSIPLGTFPISDQLRYGEEDNGYWGLGAYSYAMAQGETLPYTMEDKAAITQNPYGLFELKYMGLGTLRGAKQVDITVIDEVNGSVVLQKTDYNIRKASAASKFYGHAEIGLNPLDLNLPNNRRYTLRVEGKLDYGDGGVNTNLNNVYQSSFYIDSESPSLVTEQMQLRVVDNAGAKQYWLDIPVYDNHYSQAMFLCTYKDIDYDAGALIGMSYMDEYMTPLNSKLGSVTMQSFNITSYYNEILNNDNKLFVEVVDYAMNFANYFIELPQKPVDTINFKTNSSVKTLQIGQTADLKEEIITSPTDAWVNNLEFESSNPSVAKVSNVGTTEVVNGREISLSNGIVTALSAGKTTITAWGFNSVGDKVQNTFEITVSNTEYNKRLDRLVLDKTALNLRQGDEGYLTVSYSPYNLDEIPQVSWSTRFADRVFIKPSADGLSCYYKVLDESAGAISIEASSGLVMTTCQLRVRGLYDFNGAVLEKYHGKGGAVVQDGIIVQDGVVEIPADKDLLYIGLDAFRNNADIKKVIIPEGVTTINESAFEFCSSLVEVVLPSTLKTINENAFASCYNLETINLNNVEIIGARAFADTKLNSVSLSSAIFVGDYAFASGNYYYMEGGNASPTFSEADLRNVKFIGQYAFAGNSALYSVNINAKTVGDMAFVACTNLTTVVFNNKVDIGNGAFMFCFKLQNINFFAGAGVIGSEAFKDCTSLTEFTIPNGTEIIGSEAFGGCVSLKTVIISAGANLSTLGIGLFGNSELNFSGIEEFRTQMGNVSLTVKDGVVYDITGTKLLLFPTQKQSGEGFENGVFTVDSKVTTIGVGAFSGAEHLTKVVLNNVTTIESGAFAFCSNLTEIEFSSKLEHIGDAAFYQCRKLNIGILEGTSENNSRNIYYAQSLQYIGENAFAEIGNDTNNFKLTLNRNVSHIGAGAFAGISRLTDVNFALLSSLPSLSDELFLGCSSLNSISFGIINSLKTVGIATFQDCTSLTSVSLPNSVTSISPYTFYRCTRLQTVTMTNVTVVPDSAFLMSGIVSLNATNLTEIGDASFFQAEQFTGLTGSTANLTRIGSWAFSLTKMSSLSAINVVEVGEMLFTYFDDSDSGSVVPNTMVTSVNLPKARVIGTAAFRGCVSLTSISLPLAEVIGYGAFMDCSSLASVSLPSVTHMEGGVFFGTKITSISLPSSIVSVEDSAFSGMELLAEISVEANDYLFVDSGALYSVLPTGGYQLEAYPCQLTATSLTVLNGTRRIAPNAFEGNKSLLTVELSRTVLAIGSSAFNNTNVTTYIFNSVKMPILEGYLHYNSEVGLYVPYTNFGSAGGLTMKRPQNGVGYDNFNLLQFFDEVVITGNALLDSTVEVMALISALPSTITLSNLAEVRLVLNAYNTLVTSQKALVTNYSVLQQAVSVVMQAEAESIASAIAQLPGKVTQQNKEEIEAIRARLDALGEEYLELVTNVDRLLSAEQQLSAPQPSNNFALVLTLCLSAVLLCAAAVFGVIFVKRKGKEVK